MSDIDDLMKRLHDDDERRAENVRHAVAEVKQLVSEGETFMEASCIVITWFIINHLDDVLLDESLRISYGYDLQTVQDLIRAVFGGDEM